MKDQPVLDHFESLYACAADPYGSRTRWYEQRKRDIVMASLPRVRFQRCYEPGCGNAELTAMLAARCDAVLAADFSAEALRVAQTRTADLAHVRLARHSLPDQWPVGERFDLIVLSEVLYFLSPDDVRAVARHCVQALEPDGIVLTCDWMPDFEGRASPTPGVHAALAATGLQVVASHDEADFSVRVWSHDARSVAQREGIR